MTDAREALVGVTMKHLTDAHAYLSLRHNAETLTDKILAEFDVTPRGEGDPEAVRARLYTPEGQVRQEVLDEVEAAIRRYPNMDAPWWLGGVAAVGAVYRAVVRPRGGVVMTERHCKTCVCGCTCGFGGLHVEDNPRCALTTKEADDDR